MTAELLITDLAPGEGATLDASVGLASCDPALDYQVPPGDYELVVVVDRVVSERSPVTVVGG